MHATVGDELIIRSRRDDEHERAGIILEVRGANGEPPFRVRWEDNGHEGLVFPGPDAIVRSLGSGEPSG